MLEEGFGWPILEAMSCGCPVVTTGKSPAEVGGDAVVIGSFVYSSQLVEFTVY